MVKNKLNEIIKEKNIDVIISFAPQTRIWFTKLNMSENQPLFIENEKAIQFADSRYIEYALKNGKNAEIKLFNKKNIDEFIFLKNKVYKRIAIEKEYLTISQIEIIKNWFPSAELISISAKYLRIIKSEEEINLIKKACEISLKSLNELKLKIKPGISEKDLDAELEYLLRKNGADKSSFDAIIASGPNSSKPHYRAGERILQDGDQLKIDFGVVYKGYCSDITRTISVGKLKNNKLIEINKILKEAQSLGKSLVKPGISTFEIDNKIRNFIDSKGFGEYFIHSTGHGLGIDVHELPNVTNNKKYETILEPGMIITIEPGIYLPGIGGIRIEDDILVTKEGNQVLSEI